MFDISVAAVSKKDEKAHTATPHSRIVKYFATSELRLCHAINATKRLINAVPNNTQLII